MTRKIWDDKAGKFIKRTPTKPQPELALPAPQPIASDEYDLSRKCDICNAKPDEKCAGIIDASKTFDVPHYTRRKVA